MATRILITGILPFDSGKTSLARQLVQGFVDSGVRTEYFKPTSGHNYWYRSEHTAKCVDEGLLYSFDLRRLVELLPSGVPVQLRNPVHSLFCPAVLDDRTRAPVTTLGLAGWESHLVMQRFTRPRTMGHEDTVLVAERLVREGLVLISEREVAQLVGDAARVSVESLDDCLGFEQVHLEECVSECFAFLEKRADTIVVESFNDSVWPWSGLSSVDMVLSVGPGQLFHYSAAKVRAAADLYTREGHSTREVTFSRVSDLIRPVKRYRLYTGTGLSPQDLRQLTGKDD
ncbi:MAG: hypothetical protein HXY34_06385 [Candidatus Thorarchaeota archaeon]|nr:hypothetical protein [Candidatus Thorarchaeota archaeon]